ncbi:coiled-coil domain-containing protein [Mycoplasmopsis cynos]|uniref:Uncharacterized protein n=1 Tax=Mycoplasmopsis cynos (strain C142) TaxID=1246955 RepID=L0RV08_MYCC1|nr:hypothetical protein [Mycoplasmopsis cynos]CCP24399.1 Hypothetical protein MCYN_0667 [Mycoplasmopsis cynos C142]
MTIFQLRKKALIAKTNASTLNKEEKKKLLELFKDLKTTSTLFDNEIIINYEILKDALKKQAANRIELLENDNFKKIIKNSFGKAKTIKDYYDILIRINEHEFGRINNPKIDSKDKTDLLNKIGQIKTIITPSDNALANDSGIKMIINETILDLKNSLDYLEKNEVQNKKSELNELIKKLTELKKEIDDLKSTDVLEYSKTRKELAKKLAKSKDDQSIEDTKLYIKKAKLKKKASELPYPNGVDSVAIYEINSRIDSTKKDNLKSIEDLISKLPKKINEAKELIAQISESGKDINGQRTKDLNDQLSRSVDDEDFDKLKEKIQRTKIKILIISLPYPNPNSTDAQNSKSILNNKVNNAKSKQELDNLNSEINALNVKMNQFINLLSRIPYDDDKPKTAIETIKKVLDKVTTVQDVENILPEDWNQRILEYKTIINDDFLGRNRIQNLLVRLNQTVPSTLKDNKPFPIGDYKENQLISEILKEFKIDAIVIVNKLNNLKIMSNKQKHDDFIKRINSKNVRDNYQWAELQGDIDFIKQRTNEAIKYNYDYFIDNNLAYPNKQELSQFVAKTKEHIKMHLTSGITYKSIVNVERILNELKTKIDSARQKIGTIKNLVSAVDKKAEFERELAQTDDKGIDKLIIKIEKYNQAVGLLEQIKNDNDKTNIRGRLQSANTIEDLNNVIIKAEERIKEINDAKKRAETAINSIPTKYGHSKTLKSKYLQEFSKKDSLSLSALKKLADDAELEKYRSDTQDWIDAKLERSNSRNSELFNKLNRVETSLTRESVDQIRKEVEDELNNIRKIIVDRVYIELYDNATQIFPRSGKVGEAYVKAEKNYYDWFKEEIKKRSSEIEIKKLEYKFITERYAQSVWTRAFLRSFKYNIEHNNELNSNSEIKRHLLNMINNYATQYESHEANGNDKDDGFTIYDFWRKLNLYMRNLELNKKLTMQYKNAMRKAFSLSAQIEAPQGNAIIYQVAVKELINKSILSKVIDKLAENAIKHTQYKATDLYTLINQLLGQTISDEHGNTYQKILKLKDNDAFKNIITGSGSKGLIENGQLWNSNLTYENAK